jgi:hypothetical protein
LYDELLGLIDRRVAAVLRQSSHKEIDQHSVGGNLGFNFLAVDAHFNILIHHRSFLELVSAVACVELGKRTGGCYRKKSLKLQAVFHSMAVKFTVMLRQRYAPSWRAIMAS